jgi:hypothetical protein
LRILLDFRLRRWGKVQPPDQAVTASHTTTVDSTVGGQSVYFLDAIHLVRLSVLIHQLAVQIGTGSVAIAHSSHLELQTSNMN